ncbi:hypothetical protein [uncultured Pontibacter sp.]|uniref:hypothetical protein n=1 Tax=uncultured Pontibacter sp. TaxID=453356 RepID=UPI002622741B|nr:hypothetical protein [uncultured Pontibacter sp.]
MNYEYKEENRKWSRVTRQDFCNFRLCALHAAETKIPGKVWLLYFAGDFVFIV